MGHGNAMIGFLPMRNATTCLVRDIQPRMAIIPTTLESTAAKALPEDLYRLA